MRREILSDWTYDKVTSKRSKDLINKVSQQGNAETWWRRTTATLLSVSFGAYNSRCRDVLIGRQA